MSEMDDLLDLDWKPNPRRPQSTMARSFSAQLDDVFSLSGGVEDLSVSIMSKQQSVHTQNRELEALEAKLREMEEKLEESKKKRNRLSQQSPSGSHPVSPHTPSGKFNSRERPRLEEDTFKDPSGEKDSTYARSPLSSPIDESYSDQSAGDESPRSERK